MPQISIYRIFEVVAGLAGYMDGVCLSLCLIDGASII